MALTKGKHNIVEIDGIRCTLVETGVTAERLEFLKNLLSFNKFSVKSEQEKAKDGTLLNTFFIGVTDILFNPAIALYQKKMFRPDGEFVTPAFWNQWADQQSIPYWQVKR
jgi:hypothetical protein